MEQSFPLFSKNGKILSSDQATIPLSNIEYQYGFGVYETLKVRNGILYFVSDHVERLFTSAEIIGLTHPFTHEKVTTYLDELVNALGLDTEKKSCNLKMLLIGGRDPQLFIIALKPLFPDRKLYKNGAKVLTVHYERIFPHAKSLNMLPSYLAYKKAKEHGCYDALLLDSKDHILEGTRTNFFVISDKQLFTPPKEFVLEGVTLKTVAEVAKQNGYTLAEKPIPLSDIQKYDGAFLTSTSTKIMPISQIDETSVAIPESLVQLMKAYDKFLDECGGVFRS